MKAQLNFMQIVLIAVLALTPTAGCSDDGTGPELDNDPTPADTGDLTYPVVDTGQTTCYGVSESIADPAPGDPFHGQDAQYTGNAPAYQVNGDGTVTDLVTGLMWQQDPGAKMTLAEAQAAIGDFDLGGYNDWRIPSVKELYSLIRFDGTDPSGMPGDDTSLLTPFIDTVFAFEYGDPSIGERIIDSQFLSSTIYIGTTMGGDPTVFGVNFADGRIKGYPITSPMEPDGKLFHALFVRSGDGYGQNDFVDNGDGTITDTATGLMWMKQDSGHLGAGDNGGLNWEDALAWSENLDHADYTDWRLPDVKELQSLLDYSHAPLVDGMPAIDPVFETTSITVEDGSTDYPFYWSSTSHVNFLGGSAGCYVAFGTGYGFMEAPPGSGNYNFWDVHGAGCQRSDPKDGDPADYPYGHGPQGDVIRIFNHVRCVRTLTEISEVETPEAETMLALSAAPNPFNPMTTLTFAAPAAGRALIEILSVDGRRLASLVQDVLAVGEQRVTWNGLGDDGSALPSGVYLARLRLGKSAAMTKLTLVR